MSVPLQTQLVCTQRWLTYLRAQGPKFVKRGDWTQERLLQEITELTAVAATVERAIGCEESANDWTGRETQQASLT